MCGIAGILANGAPEVAQDAIHKMISASRHRGPDATGFEKIPLTNGHLFLGHARLSIIDLSELSNQPMRDPATNSWLVYNGEIYNFQELREELQNVGMVFTSRGDTEVLLKALVQWGEEALPKLKGMYAFGFWNGLKKELLLARDPLGIKPLYYSNSPGLFIFGSEVKTIQASKLGDFSLDRSAMKSFLIYGAVIRPSTVISEIKELIPGQILKVSEKGEIRFTPNPNGFLKPKCEVNLSFDEVVSLVKGELSKSVKFHLLSDVSLGIFLSGGIDSSILALMASKESRKINLLTVGFPEEEFSEVKYARIVAECAERKHEVIFLTANDLEGFLPDALSSMDQPTVDGINTYVISNVGASLGIKVLLSGLGGDELFGGYTTFRNIPTLLRYKSLLAKLARLKIKFGGQNLNKWHKILRLNEIQGFREIYLLYRSIRWAGASGGFPDGTRIPPDEFVVPYETWEALGTNDIDEFYRVAFLELTFYMANQLLRDSDVFSMANSIELRVPYLDLSVVTRALALPKHYHLGFWMGKKITKEILKEMCPELPLNRKKMGFTFPWEHWLRGSLKEMVSETLFNETLYKNVGLDFKKGKDIFAAFQNNHPLVSWYQVWSLFVLLNWQERNKISLN
jgi:asparagine synthase (glutamine-hydrolysing)